MILLLEITTIMYAEIFRDGILEQGSLDPEEKCSQVRLKAQTIYNRNYHIVHQMIFGM